MIAPVWTVDLRPTPELMLALDAMVRSFDRLSSAIEASNKIAGAVAADQRAAANTRAPGVGDVSAEGAPAPTIFNTVAVVEGDEGAALPVFNAEWRVWSRERNAILRRDYPLDVPTKTIHDRLVALPGAPIKIERIAVQAHKLGVKRSPNWQFTPPRAASNREEVERRMAVARAAVPAPAVAAVEDPPPAVEEAPPVIEAPAPVVPPPAPLPLPMPLPTPASVVQPKTRMEAIAAVSKAIDAKFKPEAEETVSVNFEYVRRWAGERSIPFALWDDLPAVNAKRERLGLPRFKRELTGRGIFG